MLNVDDAGIMSRSSEGLDCLQTMGGGKVSFTINAVSQVKQQTIQFMYMGGASTADRGLGTEIR